MGPFINLRNTDSTTPIHVETSIVIERPRAEVAAFAGDPDRVPEWYANIRSVEWKTARPMVRGTRLAFVARFLGRQLEYTYEVFELEPGRKLGMRTTQGPFPMETIYEWESLGERSTRMTLTNRGEPHGFGVVIGPLMSAAIRRENKRDLLRLKALLERA